MPALYYAPFEYARSNRYLKTLQNVEGKYWKLEYILPKIQGILNLAKCQDRSELERRTADILNLINPHDYQGHI